MWFALLILSHANLLITPNELNDEVHKKQCCSSSLAFDECCTIHIQGNEYFGSHVIDHFSKHCPCTDMECTVSMQNCTNCKTASDACIVPFVQSNELFGVLKYNTTETLLTVRVQLYQQQTPNGTYFLADMQNFTSCSFVMETDAMLDMLPINSEATISSYNSDTKTVAVVNYAPLEVSFKFTVFGLLSFLRFKSLVIGGPIFMHK